MDIEVNTQTTIGGILLGIGGAIAAVWGHITGRIKTAEAAAASGIDRVEAAAKAETKRVEDAADISFRDVWEELSQARKSAFDFREKMVATISGLPTRDEMMRGFDKLEAAVKGRV